MRRTYCVRDWMCWRIGLRLFLPRALLPSGALRTIATGATDKSKETLYMFFTPPGNFIAANFTGQ